MLLAIIILIAAGLYVCIKKEVQASSTFVIRGQPALNIGVALIAGGLLAVGLPFLCALIGIFGDFVAGLIVCYGSLPELCDSPRSIVANRPKLFEEFARHRLEVRDRI